MFRSSIFMKANLDISGTMLPGVKAINNRRGVEDLPVATAYAKPSRKVVVISVFRERVIGGISVHSTNLYNRLLEIEAEVEKVDFSGLLVAPGLLRKVFVLLGAGLQLIGHRLNGAKIFHFHGSNRAILFFLYGPLMWK